MKTLSIQQPWVWAIFDEKCRKNVENRSWATKYRGPLLIHAGKGKGSYSVWEPGEWEEFYAAEPLPAWADLTKGAVVGTVNLVACVDRRELGKEGHPKPNKWCADDGFCWFLSDPVLFDTPIVTTGKLGLFDVHVQIPQTEKANGVV